MMTDSNCITNYNSHYITTKIIIIESENKTMKEKLMKMKKKLDRAMNFIAEKKYEIVVFLNTLLTPMVVYASNAKANDSGADAKWTTLTNTYIVPWVKRLGGAVMFIGAIEFALGWQRDDPEGKTKGLRTFIAGAIVMAVGFGADSFLA